MGGVHCYSKVRSCAPTDGVLCHGEEQDVSGVTDPGQLA